MMLSRHPLPERARPLCETLEPRILYSADAGALMGLGAVAGADLAQVRTLEAASSVQLQSQLQSQARSQAQAAHEIVFIDSRVPEPLRLLEELSAARGAGAALELVMIDAGESGLAQIGRVLAGERGVSAVHIVSHGSAGLLQIGDTRLDTAELARHPDALLPWREALAPDADLLLYGCDVARGEEGVHFVAALAAVTGADVAASTNRTGSTALGGDWVLEHHSGRIEAMGLAVRADGAWTGMLEIKAGAGSTSVATTGAAILSVDHVVPGTGADLLLIVGVAIDDPSVTVTSATYGGVALTPVGRVAGAQAVELWQLVAPAPGTGSVVVNFSASTAAAIGASSFSGVDQAQPTAGFAGASGTGTVSSVDVASEVGGLVVDLSILQDNPSASAGSGQITLWLRSNAELRARSTAEPGAATVTMSTNLSTAAAWSHAAVSLRPAGAGGGGGGGGGNAAPVVTTTATPLAYAENAGALVVDGAVQVSDADGGNLAGATLSLAGYVPGEDVLGFTPQSGITGLWDSGAGVLTLSGSASVAQYQAALRSVTYSNASESPGTAARSVSISVSDGQASSAASARAITVSSDNDAPVITGLPTHVSVNEASTGVLTVTASDPDHPAGSLSYSLSSSPDQARFTIDPVTGALSFSGPPDFESPADADADNEYVVGVQVSDGSLSGQALLRVSVLPVNEHSPAITSDGGGAAGAITVTEGSTAVTSVQASDADLPAPALSYSIAGGADAGRFSIHGVSGALTFIAAPSFAAPTDANADNVYEVTVRASDGSLSAHQALSITVADPNQVAPVITSDGGGAGATLNRPENTLSVTTVHATDADGTLPTYAIAGGADAARFSIDPVSGALSFVLAPNVEAPTDAGSDNVYDVVVRAGDGEHEDLQALAIQVTPLNEAAPVITSLGGGAVATISQPEGQSGVLVVTAADADLPAAALSYSIVGGADAALFSIDAATGALAFISPPVHAQPGDADRHNSYEVMLRVSDGQLSDTQQVTVIVTPSSNAAPVIGSGGGGATALIAIAEGTSAVTVVTATDGDLPAQTLSYSLAGGADAARFAIDAVSGALVFIQAPDAEAPADADADNLYELVVRVSDGSATDTQVLQVRVLGVNEHAPVISSPGGGAGAALDVVEGSAFVATIVASDADLPAEALAYAISGGADAARFLIDPATGALSFVAAPDFESPQDTNADNRYLLTVEVSDGSRSTERALEVNVTPLNEAAPRITSDGAGASATLVVVENTTTVTTVRAIDADLPAPSITYGIAGGADAALFVIDSGTGALRFAQAPVHGSPRDADADNVYAVSVRASDGSLQDTQQLLVTVARFNERTPVITSNGGGATAAVSVAENSRLVTVVTATDGDLPAQTLSYSLAGGADAARFAIDAVSGALVFIQAPDAEAPADADADNLYELVVRVSDGSATDTQVLQVRVLGVNEHAPVISSPGGGAGAALDVVEGSAFVATIVASDADLPAEALAYAISGGADAARFLIDPATGALSFVAAPDFESPQDTNADNRYLLTVEVSDGSRSTARALEVNVTPLNEAAPRITSDGAGASATLVVVENTAAVTTVRAIDADLPAPAITYGIAGGADGARFTIDPASGVLSLVQVPDFELPADADGDNRYEVVVRASDGSLWATQSLTVRVDPVNEHAPRFDGPAGVLHLPENQAHVATLAAHDADLPPAQLVYTLAGGADVQRFSIDPASGALRFVQAPDAERPADAGADNTYQVVVQVSDGLYGSRRAIDVHVIDVDETPRAADHAATVAEGGAVTVNLPAGAASYTPPAGPAAQVVSGPAHGSLALRPDGRIVYTHDGSETAADIFTYRLNDTSGAVSATATVRIRVTPVNDAPVVTAATLAVQGGQGVLPGPANLAATDADHAAPGLLFQVSALVHGRFEWLAAPGMAIAEFTQADLAAGRVRFVATSATEASAFNIAAFDGAALSTVVEADIRFTPAPRPPVADPLAEVPTTAPAPKPPDPVAPVSAPAPAATAAAPTPVPGPAPAGPSNGDDSEPATPAATEPAGPVVRAPAPALTMPADASLRRTVMDAPAVMRSRAANVEPAPGVVLASFAAQVESGVPDPWGRVAEPGLTLAAAPFARQDSGLFRRAGTDDGPPATMAPEGQAAAAAAPQALTLAEVSQITGLALTAGTVWWALRAGGLLAGLLVTLPVWRHADLLAVLPDDAADDAWDLADDEAVRDEQAVGHLLEPGAGSGERE